jgi:tousled-like kinase
VPQPGCAEYAWAHAWAHRDCGVLLGTLALSRPGRTPARRRGAQVLPEREARAIAAQIMAGLAYLNEAPRRIIHMDLKPANVLFDAVGQAKLTVRPVARLP